MVDRDLLLIKAGKVRKHLKRAREKCDPDLAAFLSIHYRTLLNLLSTGDVQVNFNRYILFQQEIEKSQPKLE